MMSHYHNLMTGRIITFKCIVKSENMKGIYCVDFFHKLGSAPDVKIENSSTYNARSSFSSFSLFS